MARMLAVLTLFALLPVSRALCEERDKAPSKLTCQIDLILIETQPLRGLSNHQRRPACDLIPLDPIEAFFLREVDSAKEPRKRVYGRSKATYRDGQTLKFKGHPPSGRNEGEWPHGESYAFELKLNIDSPRSTSVTFKSRRNEKEKTYGPATVIDGNAVLIPLDRSPEGDYFGAILAPYVIDESESEPTTPEMETGDS